jgi:hypothetical protein
MNIKITYHIMPWEIDYALLTFTQLKRSKYHISNDFNITIETVLNLSSYLIDWDKSKLPKEYFIEKYNDISNLLCDYTHIKRIYDGDNLYGHLNLQRECITNDTDYYISICPDMCFSEYLLPYMLQCVTHITSKYFVLTPQISKFWDSSWDVITNPLYSNIDNSNWDKTDVFDVMFNNNDSEVKLSTVQQNKWAGWFDLYSKDFYETLCPILPNWSGYGGWDLYSLIIVNQVKQFNIDFAQYVLEGQTIFEYSTGPLYGTNRDGFSKYYKSMIVSKDQNTNLQRSEFENNVMTYVNETITNLKKLNII